MRTVPLIVALSFLTVPVFPAEDIGVSAGKSPVAGKLVNNGCDYEEKGDYANALKNFDEAIRLDPTMWPAYFNRASIEMKQRRLQQALRDATIALRGRTWFNRSAILRAAINMKMGNYDASFRELELVANLGSRGDAYPQALNALAWLHATCPDSRYRDGRLALKQAAQACSLTSYKRPVLVDTLAAAYAEAGDFDNAVRYEEKAIAIGGTSEEMKEFQQHMTAFKHQRPWRDKGTN